MGMDLIWEGINRTESRWNGRSFSDSYVSAEASADMISEFLREVTSFLVPRLVWSDPRGLLVSRAAGYQGLHVNYDTKACLLLSFAS